jgi:hypothetical protein
MTDLEREIRARVAAEIKAQIMAGRKCHCTERPTDRVRLADWFGWEAGMEQAARIATGYAA